MKCVFCGGKAEKRMVTFSYERKDKHLLVENVPAEVCTACGEKTYSPEVTDELLKIASQNAKPKKVIKVPVFDFAERA
jgi:HTH-type transcriptional regulator/antitoxin MqsA